MKNRILIFNKVSRTVGAMETDENQYVVKIDLYDAAKSRKTSRGNDNLMKLPSDEGSPSVEGIVLDPVSTSM